MTVLAAVLLPALELEDDDLLAAALRDDLTFDLGTRHKRGTKLGAVAAEEEDLFERDPIAGRTIKFFNAKNVAGRDPVLFSAGANDCVCDGEASRKLNAEASGRKDQSAFCGRFLADPAIRLFSSPGKTRKFLAHAGDFGL